MVDENSVNDIFRFVQLRPRRTVGEANPVRLAEGTALVKRLTGAGSVSKRAEAAVAALGASSVRSAADVPLGPQIVAALGTLRSQAGATVDELRQALPTLDATRDGRGFRACRALGFSADSRRCATSPPGGREWSRCQSHRPFYRRHRPTAVRDLHNQRGALQSAHGHGSEPQTH